MACILVSGRDDRNLSHAGHICFIDLTQYFPDLIWAPFKGYREI